jgi:hypothetical protein
MMTLKVDEETYVGPLDDRVDEELKDYLADLVHEIDGFTIKNIKILVGDRKNEQ